MPGKDDDNWEGEYVDDAPTQRVDVVPEAVPEPIRTSPDTTGRYKTLSGYEVSREIYFAQGEAHTYAKVLMGLKLWQMSNGAHILVAEVNVNMFREWMERPENAELIRVALEG